MRMLASLLFLLLSSLSFALASEVSSGSVAVAIESTKAVSVSFYSEINDTIVLSIAGEKPWMILSDSKIVIGRNETKNTTLFISPKSDTIAGLYKVTVVGESIATKQKASSEVFIAVAKEQGVYSERILIKGDLKPTGTVEIVHEIKNFGDVTVGAVLDITVSSPEGDTKMQEKIDNIDPAELKVVTTPITLPEGAKEGEYTVKSWLASHNKTFRLEQKFTVEKTAVIRNVTEYSATRAGWAKKITVRNLGNDLGSFQAEETISPFTALFFTGDAPTTAEGGRYVWKIEKIKPGKESSISYKVDYMPLIVLAVVLAIVFLFINMKVKTIRIRKFVMQKKVIREGTEFTVGVEVKNASGAEAADLVVRDHVPSVFDVQDTYGIKPHRKKTEYGTAMIWTIDKLKDGEERLFSYRIVPLFGITGKLGLHSARVSGKLGNKPFENTSASVELGKSAKKEPTLEDIFKKKADGK